MTRKDLFARFGSLFWLNILIFVLVGLGVATSTLLPHSLWLRSLQAIVVSLAVYLLSGLNLAAIAEKIFSSDLDVLEKMALAAIFGLLFPPLILTLEYSFLGLLFPSLPLLNAALIFLAAIILNPWTLDRKAKNVSPSASRLPFWIALAAYLLIIFSIVLAYYPLPDYDPYYWLPKFTEEFAEGSIVTLDLHRPLFSSFSYIFNQTAGVDLYFLFKYVFPFLFLLVFFPIALMVRNFQGTLASLALFFLPLASAGVLLYSLMPIPQALLNICIVFFVSFLVYAWFSGKNFFYFLGGVTMFVTFFYHEAAVLFFVPWFVVTLFSYRRFLWSLVRAHKLVSVLVTLLILSHVSFLAPLYNFLALWISQAYQLMPIFHPNWRFPLEYANVDGSQVGWGSWQGVAKYYLFYAGPALAVLLAGLFILWATHKREWHDFTSAFFRKELAVALWIFLVFFSLAEIFPRFFGFALLPERAWGFAGLIAVFLVPVMLRLTGRKYQSLFLAAFLAAILLNAGAALYVNAQKKYLIPPEHVESAVWIRRELPPDRIIFSRGNVNLLEVHAGSRYVNVRDPLFYTDISVFDGEYRVLAGIPGTPIEYRPLLSELGMSITQWQEDVATDPEIVASRVRVAQGLLARLEAMASPQVQTIMPQHVYIYYAAVSPKNMYAERPYFEKEKYELDKTFVFDRYPDRFRRVYADTADQVIIWKVLNP